MKNIKNLRKEVKELLRKYGEPRFAFLTGSYVRDRKTSSDLDLMVVYFDELNSDFSNAYADFQRRKQFHPDPNYPCELVREDILADLLNFQYARRLRHPVQKHLKGWGHSNLSLLYATQVLWGDNQVVDGSNILLKGFKRRSILYLARLSNNEINNLDKYIITPLGLTLTNEIKFLWENITNPKGVLFCDAGKTLICQAPIYDLFNEEYDLWDEDNRIYEQYKNRKINPKELFHKTIQLYRRRNLRYEDFLNIAKKLHINENVRSSIEYARNNGWLTICLSGSLRTCLEYKISHLFDNIISNKIIFEGNRIKGGEYECSEENKNSQMLKIANKMSVPCRNIVYVGDKYSDFFVSESLPRLGGRYFDSHDTEELNRFLHSK